MAKRPLTLTHNLSGLIDNCTTIKTSRTQSKNLKSSSTSPPQHICIVIIILYNINSFNILRIKRENNINIHVLTNSNENKASDFKIFRPFIFGSLYTLQQHST